MFWSLFKFWHKLRILWKWHKTSFSYTFPWPREEYISLRLQILRKWKHRSLLSLLTDFMGLALIISKDNPRENKISCFFNWSQERTQTEGDKQMKLQMERHCWWSKSDRRTDIIQIQPDVWNMQSDVWWPINKVLEYFECLLWGLRTCKVEHLTFFYKQ